MTLRLWSWLCALIGWSRSPWQDMHIALVDRRVRHPWREARNEGTVAELKRKAWR